MEAGGSALVLLEGKKDTLSVATSGNVLWNYLLECDGTIRMYDLNYDDLLSEKDVAIIRQRIAEKDTSTEYDITGDCLVDVRDLVRLKKHVCDGEKDILLLEKGVETK